MRGGRAAAAMIWANVVSSHSPMFNGRQLCSYIWKDITLQVGHDNSRYARSRPIILSVGYNYRRAAAISFLKKNASIHTRIRS